MGPTRFSRDDEGLGAATADHDPSLIEALLAHAPVGVGLLDRELRYRHVNRALAAMSGQEPDEHLGRTAPEVLGVAGTALEELLRGVLESGEPVHDAHLGGERPWLVSALAVRDDDGAVQAVGVVARAAVEDDAELKRAQAMSALLGAAFAAAPVGLGVWGLDGRYERVNEAMAEINGRPAAEHVGRAPEELLGELGEQVGALLRQVVATGEPVVQARLAGHVPGTGPVQYRDSSYFPVVGEDSAVIGVGGVVRDVTEAHEEQLDRAELLQEALIARAQAQAAQVRAESAQAEAEEARRRTAFLARAGGRLLASMEYETTLRDVVRLAVPAVADGAAMTLVQPSGALETVAVAHVDADKERLARALAGHTKGRRDPTELLVAAMRTGKPQHVEEVGDQLLALIAEDAEHLELLRELDPRSVLAVPLRTPERNLGVLTLFHGESGRRFDHDAITLARGLAARAALAVENARLYTERSHIAQTLQRSLLPTELPTVPGLELAARYRASGDQNEVGGDFYDVFACGEGLWTTVIGDVTGKGPEAAGVTALARHTLRAGALRAPDPVANLRLLNDALRLPAGPATPHYCTVLCALLRAKQGQLELTFANAGHLPPLLVHADGQVERLPVAGTLLGPFPAPPLGTHALRLAPGELVLMLTDGATEVRTSDTMLGERVVEETLRVTAGQGAEAVVDAVLSAAVDVQEGEPRDDIALLALRAVS